MPELPEVETIRQNLLPILTGRTVSKVEILTPGVWLGGNLTPSAWMITDIDRRGKYLIFRLIPSGGDPTAGCRMNPAVPEDGLKPACREARLVVHLRMTGRLLLQTSDSPASKHDHIRIRLDQPLPAGQLIPDPIWLVFHDTRRFGRIWLISDRDSAPPAGLERLGPEPLDPGFGREVLSARLAGRPRGKLKAVLLDQTVVAGLGNIYADEVLFASGLHPARQAGSLDEAAIGRLSEAIVRVLHRAVACQGTTLRDYVNSWNRKGSFQDCLMVYGRSGLPCLQCGNPIRSSRLAGRASCWCPVCQPDISQT